MILKNRVVFCTSVSKYPIYLLHVKEIEVDPVLLGTLKTSIQAAHNAISSLDDIALRENLLHLVDKAFIDGVYQTMILGCVISVISGILAIWLLPRGKEQ